MNGKSKSGFASLVMLVTAFLFLNSQTVLASKLTTPETGQISVDLNSSVSLDSLVDALKARPFDSVTVQSSFSANGRTYQDFVTIYSGQQANEIAYTWREARKGFVAQLEKDHFFGDTQALSVSSLDIPVGIKNFKINGGKQVLQNIAARFAGAAVNYRSDTEIKKSKAEVNNPAPRQEVKPISSGNDQLVQTMAVANTPYYKLVPFLGSTQTAEWTWEGVLSEQTRGVVNYMNWDSNLFASDQTYEHDFFLLKDSTSPGTYFARSFSSTDCVPKAVYFSTSWPAASYPFLDSDLEKTGLCTSSGWIAYSLGAGQANAITPEEHVTYVFMPDGDASTDKFLLQGQIGYQKPVGCHGALCSYPYGYNVAERTHYGLVKNGDVPGFKTWTWKGVTPDAPTNTFVNNPTASSLKLNFRDISWDETNIAVERSINVTSDFQIFNFGTLNAGNTVGDWSWTTTGLKPKTRYCFRLKASNAIGSSAYTSGACGTTL